MGTRGLRADRILWASAHVPPYTTIAGRSESLALLEEARGTFVAGHYVATLMVAMAYIEHALGEALNPEGDKRSPMMAEALKLARQHDLFSSALLDRAAQLSRIRNPYAHLRPVEDGDTLWQRMHAAKIHPRVLQEADAKEALSVMYAFLREELTG